MRLWQLSPPLLAHTSQDPTAAAARISYFGLGRDELGKVGDGCRLVEPDGHVGTGAVAIRQPRPDQQLLARLDRHLALAVAASSKLRQPAGRRPATAASATTTTTITTTTISSVQQLVLVLGAPEKIDRVSTTEQGNIVLLPLLVINPPGEIAWSDALTPHAHAHACTISINQPPPRTIKADKKDGRVGGASGAGTDRKAL